jgi:hypothetical protein
MDDERIHEHIAAVDRRDEAEALTLIGRIQRTYWPGGEGDRTEPSGRGWLQRWRPARSGAALPACSCTQGRCAVCN